MARSQVERRDVLDVDLEPGPGDDVACPVGPRREQAVDEVVDAADRVLGEELDDGVGDVGGVGRRAPLVVHGAERLAGGRRAVRGIEDPAREVAARGPNSHAVRAIPSAAPAAPRMPRCASRSPASLDAPYGLTGRRARPGA